MPSHTILGVFQAVNDTNNRAVLQVFQSSLTLQINIFAELAGGSKDNRNKLMTGRVSPLIRLPLQTAVKYFVFRLKNNPKRKKLLIVCILCI